MVLVLAAVPGLRSHERDAFAVARIATMRVNGTEHPTDRICQPAPGQHASLVASGAARDVIRVARSTMGTKYVLGAAPRHAWSLRHVPDGRNPIGLDCSTLVAYAFVRGAGIWPGGEVAHTDEIWTQGRTLPLDYSPRSTSHVLRGNGAQPPPEGYQPGDLVFRRQGAGGWWGHVAIVGEHGYVVEALPPDVHETPISDFLADGDRLGWMRLRDLDDDVP